jgi:hypothetical protein
MAHNRKVQGHVEKQHHQVESKTFQGQSDVTELEIFLARQRYCLLHAKRICEGILIKIGPTPSVKAVYKETMGDSDYHPFCGSTREVRRNNRVYVIDGMLN